MIVPQLVKKRVKREEDRFAPYAITPKPKELDPMRLNLLFPEVKPEPFQLPKQCPTKGCAGKRFYPRQQVEKNLVEGKDARVKAWRYQGARGCVPNGE